MKRWIKRISLCLLSLVVVLVASGALYEALARARASREFPPLGRLIDVDGGRHIQLDCRGSGTPTVVFESETGMSGSLLWAPVQT